ncbi:hypothetical protein V498_06368, partial [Pseudogymnoascus sp. VKM F-4517 (FW-2822)]
MSGFGGGFGDGFGGGQDDGFGGGFGGGQGDAGAAGGNDGACFNCGEQGHMKGDCPNPRAAGAGQLTGECFNCGEVGHNKADCPNPQVPREFTGTCRVCEAVGHRAADCPTAGPKICKNCGDEGHTITACTNPRKIDRSKIDDVEAEVAWEGLCKAVKDRDMDDVKEAFLKYVKACPEATYPQLEEGFRDMNVPLYLIGLQ